MPIAISKTRVLSYLQCPKRLWLDQYSPELEDEEALDLAAIETGRVVGEMARRVYGNGKGHLVNHNLGLRAAVAETTALLDAGGKEPIFEATFDHDGLTVQVDVLDRAGDTPRIVEVKSSTTVKDHFLADCAVQAWAMTELGLQPESTSVALIDSTFSYAGDGGYAGLFREIDVTAELEPLLATMPETVAATRATLESLDEPERNIGAHCMTPHACPFFAHCSPEQGEYPVLGLGGPREPLYDLMLEGVSDLRELSEDQLANETQQRIWRQTVDGDVYIGAALAREIAALSFPRYFLDFETIGFAIPVWEGTRPYEPLPFQWSCHTDDGNGSLRHAEFLDLTGEPPMRRLAEALIEALGDAGPVIVYTAYEQSVLNGLKQRFTDLAPALDALTERLVDLHPLARQHYYHPQMRGSWSIKAILPTITSDVDYAGLAEVRDGAAAQSAYLEAIHPDTTSERRETLREALTAYCRLDTLALVRLVEFFGASDVAAP